MSTQIYANSNEMASKAASGKSIAAFPDVCYTPPSPPVGPIPLPYPNTCEVKDTDNGTAKVFIKDKMVGMEGDSYLTKSMGDEAATPSQGKSVLNGALQGKCYFKLWSMDVMLEGKGVPRHLDMMTHNHACEAGDTAGIVFDNTAPGSPAKDRPADNDALTTCKFVKIDNQKYESGDSIKARCGTPIELNADGSFAKGKKIQFILTDNTKNQRSMILSSEKSTTKWKAEWLNTNKISDETTFSLLAQSGKEHCESSNTFTLTPFTLQDSPSQLQTVTVQGPDDIKFDAKYDLEIANDAVLISVKVYFDIYKGMYDSYYYQFIGSTPLNAFIHRFQFDVNNSPSGIRVALDVNDITQLYHSMNRPEAMTGGELAEATNSIQECITSVNNFYNNAFYIYQENCAHGDRCKCKKEIQFKLELVSNPTDAHRKLKAYKYCLQPDTNVPVGISQWSTEHNGTVYSTNINNSQYLKHEFGHYIGLNDEYILYGKKDPEDPVYAHRANDPTSKLNSGAIMDNYQERLRADYMAHILKQLEAITNEKFNAFVVPSKRI